MSDPTLSYSPLPGVTPQAEAVTLAAVYSFLMRRNGAEAAEVGGGPDTEGGEEGGAPEAPPG